MLGAYLGYEEDLLGPGPDNPAGFWENKDIVDIHERLLRSYSRFWHDIRPLPDGWWNEPEVNMFREEIATLVSKYISASVIWAWKDPRTAILLPLWKGVLDDLCVHVDYVICVRNPIDVALSLQRIHGFSLAKSMSLWQLYNLSALHWTNDGSRIIISYDDLLENKEVYLGDVLNNMRVVLNWPEMKELYALNNVIISNLRHHIHHVKAILDDGNIPGPVRRLCSLLIKGAWNRRSISTRVFYRSVERLYNDYCGYSSMFSLL